MADIVKLSTAAAEQQRRAELAERAKDPWLQLPQKSRDRALLRQQIIGAVLIGLDQGLKPRRSAEMVWETIETRTAPPDYLALCDRSPKLSAATLERWTRDYLDGGLFALADKRKGRQRKDYGWELRAVALWQQPQRRYYGTIARILQQEGWDSASEHNVRRYLQSLPSNEHETNRKRVGAHYYRQNIGKHAIRTTEGLPVGFIYEGDGHTCDVYVAHPVTGRHYRPELTFWIDVRSRLITGWWLSESESGHSTLFSASSALVDHDHVPCFFHVDPGAGFKAKLITDEVVGWLARFGIKVIFALPGNSKGKGLIEGLWRWFEEWCGKNFETFCGHCRTDDALQRLQRRIERGEIRLPSFNEYADAVRAFIAYWNTHEMDVLDGRSPADLWAELERVPLEIRTAAVCRPRDRRTVRRWSITFRGRVYRSAELEQYERREVQFEYQLQNDAEIAVYDLDGRLIAIAPLVEKTPWLSDSHIEEAAQKRLHNQRKRKMAALAEDEARARLAIPSTSNVFEAISDAKAPLPQAPVTTPVDEIAVARTEALERSAAAQETPFDRWQRFQALQARIAAGEPLDAADVQWMNRYRATSEFRGHRLMEEGPE